MLNTIPIGSLSSKLTVKFQLPTGGSVFLPAVYKESIYDFSKYKVCRPETGEPMGGLAG